MLLRDANGQPRLSMQVTPDRKASIDFLDADGKFQRSITADELANNDAASKTEGARPLTASQKFEYEASRRPCIDLFSVAAWRNRVPVLQTVA